MGIMYIRDATGTLVPVKTVQGATGKDGNGIKSAVLNADYTLTLTFDDGTIYTTPTIRGAAGSNGTNGSDGKDGDDGVGIASIKQTTTSTADGGENVFTVTLTNDTTATFTVKNGSKGSAGADGNDGTSVTVKSVSESTEDGGSNVVTFSDGTTVTIKNGKTGAAGDDGYTPVKGTDYFTEADKTEMVEAVKTSLDAIPSYWVSALDTGVQTINSAVEAAGRNKSAFLFYTDAHWGYGSGMSPKLLKYLSKRTAINKTVFGGDFGNTYEYPDTGKTQADWMNVMREWRLAVRDVPNHHSVVGNHDQDVEAIQSDKALYGFLFAPEETSDIVRGGDFFYYIDEPNERTRYLYLNTGLCDFSDEQCKFFIEALKTTPDSWHIVAVSHIWFMYDDTSDPTVGSVPVNIQKVLKLFDDYNARATGSMTIDTESNAYDFADCNGWVEFCIGGHTHVDYNFTSDSGIPVILCQTDSKHLRGNLYTYTEGTTTEAAVSAIVADYDEHKIHVIRVGRGESSEIEITNYVVSYTNVLPLALAADGASVYNADATPGYKADTRWSSSGNSEGTASGVYLTGWIPCKIGDTVYLKNVTMPKVEGNACIIHQFNNSFATAVQNSNATYIESSCNGVWDESGNLTQFTLPTNTQPTTHIRIQCGGISEVSVITINEPIE